MDIYTDVNKDMTSERKVVLDDGHVLTVKRHDPYGMWTIHYDHGQLPQKYTGSYTLFDLALQDIKKYIQDKDVQITDIQVTYQQSA